MTLATLVISGRDWILPAAAFVTLMGILLAWTYRRAPAHPGLRTAAFALKLLGLLTLAACLVEPLWTTQRARPGANLFAILADNSQGMGIKDRDARETRGQFLHHLLTQESALWPAKLDQNFQVRRYLFDSRLQSTRDFSELAFDGRSTALATSLRDISERYRGQPLSGVLLFTDGNATDLPDGKFDATGLPPIYPVVIGTDDPIRDVALQKVSVSQTAFEDAPVNIQADATGAGYSGRPLTAQVLDATGKKVAEQSLRAPADGEATAFRFQLKPEAPGLSFYRVQAAAQDEMGEFEQPSTSAEATLANNRRLVLVNRGKGPHRILYIAGQPKWEYRFMHRALDEDEQLKLVSMIRIARREPKFAFRGRPGESSNPLFRGFDNQEEVEKYDQPVFIRLLPDGADSAELVGGFPKTAEELYSKYDAVVINDLEAEYFTRDQMTLLQKFVSERGGGFLMMGGADAFREGKYERTPVGDMLPVYLDHVTAAGDAKEFHLSLTHEGWLQPWARVRNNEADEQKRIQVMPPFMTLNRVRDMKPGASSIASVKDEHGVTHPALVVQRFGNGRVGALMLTDLWRWGMRDEASHKDMDKAWRQMFRWLVSDVPNRIDLQVELAKNDPNQAMRLQVRVRDKAFKPMDNVSAVLTIRTVTSAPPGTNGVASPALRFATNSIRLPAEASPREPGLYEATYIPRETGGYLVEAVVTDATGAELGRAESGWTSDPAADEFSSLRPNRALLERIAQQTGGKVIAAEKLDDFATALPNRQAPIMEEVSAPLWNRSAVFLFALACFIGEWGLRRWKGLA